MLIGRTTAWNSTSIGGTVSAGVGTSRRSELEGHGQCAWKARHVSRSGRRMRSMVRTDVHGLTAQSRNRAGVPMSRV